MCIIAKSDLFPSLSDIAFAEKDPDTITQELVNLYEQVSGRTLARADPVRLFIDAIILAIVHQRNVIDNAAKMNLLAYASGEYLDHIGALLGVTRLSASHALTTLQFTLAHTYSVKAIIPQGTRVSAGGDITFATTSELTIPAGELTGNVEAQAITSGESLNGYIAGQVNVILDPLSYEISAENITATNGGTDIESDENFRERIQIAPESFSVAGPKKAYEYFARSANADIIDAAVIGPPTTQPGYVEIYPLMTGGLLPSDEVLNEVYEVCNAENIRPDTDYLTVKAPVAVNYALNVTFWIDENNSSSSQILKALCETAASDWITWQRSALGRDINPSELVHRLVEAGAKRVEVSSPSFRVLNDWELAVCSSQSITYGGLEKG